MRPAVIDCEEFGFMINRLAVLDMMFIESSRVDLNRSGFPNSETEKLIAKIMSAIMVGVNKRRLGDNNIDLQKSISQVVE